MCRTFGRSDPSLPDKPPINLTPNCEDIEYIPVTKREVRDAIFTAAQLNAPGISGLTGHAWRWGWSILHEEIYNLLRLTADSTTHQPGEPQSQLPYRN